MCVRQAAAAAVAYHQLLATRPLPDDKEYGVVVVTCNQQCTASMAAAVR